MSRGIGEPAAGQHTAVFSIVCRVIAVEQSALADSECLVSGERCIRWGNGPVAFELRSPDVDIIEAAERVFGRWRPFDDAPVRGRWEAHWKDDTIAVHPRRAPDEGSERQPIRSADHAVAVVEYSAIWEIVESCEDLLCFHAALLSKNELSVAIVGPSHAGKSTLAAGLWQSGWRLHCDDLTMVVDNRALAGPRRVALRSECREQLGDDLWTRVSETDGYFKTSAGYLFQPMHLDETDPESMDLSAIFFLNRNGAVNDAGPERLNSAHAALALLPYTNIVRSQPFPIALAPVAELMADVPAWDLPRAPLPEMISSVERLTAGVSDNRRA